MIVRIPQKPVLFDLDGTLVDSRAAVTESYARVFRDQLGRSFPPPELRAEEVFAMRPAELFGHLAPERAEALHTAYRAAYHEHARLVKGFPGARELVLALAQAGRRPGLVTNKGLDRTLIDLETLALDPGVFAAIVAAEDTPQRKPDPSPILLGLARAGGVASEAIYVGDGPHDIEAAHAAGMPGVAVTYGFYGSADLNPCHPEYIVGSIAELADVLGVSLKVVAAP